MSWLKSDALGKHTFFKRKLMLTENLHLVRQ